MKGKNEKKEKKPYANYGIMEMERWNESCHLEEESSKMGEERSLHLQHSLPR